MADTPITGKTRLQEALDHVKMGFWVVSVWSTTPDGTCKCVRGPSCPSAGKHPIPPKGFLAASNDPEVVATMMSHASEPNYGIVWPEGDEIVVILDVDGEDWAQKIRDQMAIYGRLPETKATMTPSGGRHVFFRWPKGVPVPAGNELRGWVCRFPWKGYVVGPGSAIGGKVYMATGPSEMAILPLGWAQGEAAPTSSTTITIGGGYELPASVPTGSRHDAIVRFVASRWNKGITKPEIEAAVRSVLAPLFTEKMPDDRLQHEIDGAYETAIRKWGEPGSGVAGFTATGAAEIVGVDLLEADTPTQPPPMGGAAYVTSSVISGLINHLDPRTDASFEGMAVVALTYLGALLGHTPCAFYGSREQHAAFFSTLVGQTGTRKGTLMSLNRSALSQCTDAMKGIKQSPNSGEGLIALAARNDGAPMVIEEEEFDRVLIAKGREGSTLGSILRQAFDDIPLTSATATKIVRSENHHIAFIGNTTREDVAAKMAQVDLKNGFVNRILWTAMFPRDRALTVYDNALPYSLRDEIRDVLKWASLIPPPMAGGITHMLTEPARDLLADASAKYGTGVGLAPFVSRRLDTIAARIALIYACLWKQREIGVDQVEAALAVTDYGWASAKWLFPETTGDLDADLVLRHLRKAKFLNMTEIEALVGKRAKDKQRVADMLMLMGYARIAERPRRDGKPGRPQKGLELT